jgi:hypothetical protein
MIFCNRKECRFRIRTLEDRFVCSQLSIAIGKDGKCVTFISNDIEIEELNKNTYKIPKSNSIISNYDR